MSEVLNMALLSFLWRAISSKIFLFIFPFDGMLSRGAPLVMAVIYCQFPLLASLYLLLIASTTLSHFGSLCVTTFTWMNYPVVGCSQIPSIWGPLHLFLLPELLVWNNRCMTVSSLSFHVLSRLGQLLSPTTFSGLWNKRWSYNIGWSTTQCYHPTEP